MILHIAVKITKLTITKHIPQARQAKRETKKLPCIHPGIEYTPARKANIKVITPDGTRTNKPLQTLRNKAFCEMGKTS